MRSATRRRGTTFVPRTTRVPKISKEQAKELLAPVLLRFTRKQLADGSGCTTDAAKAWHEKKRFPNGESLINLARAFPCVDDWLNDVKRPSFNPDPLPEAFHAMQRDASLPGPQGDAARAWLQAWRAR